MEIDRCEMNKNTVKSDFKKSSPINGKIQIKNGGESALDITQFSTSGAALCERSKLPSKVYKEM